jgi:hypothetical protein
MTRVQGHVSRVQHFNNNFPKKPDKQPNYYQQYRYEASESRVKARLQSIES